MRVNVALHGGAAAAGYGYELHRPFVALLIAGLVGEVIFFIAQHSHTKLIIPAGQDQVPPFYPFHTPSSSSSPVSICARQPTGCQTRP
jgi:hypothetical protein